RLRRPARSSSLGGTILPGRGCHPAGTSDFSQSKNLVVARSGLVARGSLRWEVTSGGRLAEPSPFCQDRAVGESGRPSSFERFRRLALVGRLADWGMGRAAASPRTLRAGTRIAGLKVTESVCPYCAVGCGQVVYTRAGELVDIEGNPRSPINQGTLCPKGSASRQLVQQPGRLTKVRYRAPGASEFVELELERAMDMIADRVIAACESRWE